MNIEEIVLLGSTPEPNSGCRLWMGGANGEGYPKLKSGTLVTRAILGLTDPRIYACHTCDQPICVERRHLFAGTNSDNQIDRVKKHRNAFAEQKFCLRGHPFDEANTYWRNGRRWCRACNRLAQREIAERRRGSP